MSLSVFVSSPSRDLKEIRSLVCELVQNRGITSDSMLRMLPGKQSPLDYSLKSVAACDLYVGLLGFQYGSVPIDRGRNPGKCSFTELEYREAKRLGKSIAMFLCRRDVDPRHKEPAPKRLAVKRFRQELMDKHCVGEFTDWKDLRPKVSRQLDAWVHMRHLERELEQRYPGPGDRRRYFVVEGGWEDAETDPGSTSRVFETTARLLLAEIRRGVARLAGGKSNHFRVGVAGGLAHSRVVDCLQSDPALLAGEDFSGLVFIAVNSAALPKRYAYTANYLVARLSTIFGKSTHLACLPGPGLQRKSYEMSVDRIELMLGGAGARDGFLSKWLDDRDASLDLPPQVVGDFCYVPIDRNGNALKRSRDRAVRAVSALVVKPTFSNLGEFRTQTILPLLGQPQCDPAGSAVRTLKQGIGEIVLSSLRHVQCVIDERTATELLCLRLCGYVVGEGLGSDDEGGELYRASLRGRPGEVVLRIVHQSDGARRTAPVKPDVRADGEILISDPPGPRNDRVASVFLRWNEFVFDVDPEVRRPGLWSSSLARVGASLVGGKRNVTVLDVGCGTGAVGYLVSACADCESVTFSDIEQRAVSNAQRNRPRFESGRTKFRFVESNLFEAIDGRYDLILFSPPFLPTVGIWSDTPIADEGGRWGTKLCEAFARDVRQHLRAGGHAVMALASYVQFHSVRDCLLASGLSVDVRETPILYPQQPALGWPQAYEVRDRSTLESKLGGSPFRDEFRLDGQDPPSPKHYVSFRMVHLVAQLRDP